MLITMYDTAFISYHVINIDIQRMNIKPCFDFYSSLILIFDSLTSFFSDLWLRPLLFYVHVYIIALRNKVVKVMFLHLCVILFTGGVCLSACWGTPQPQIADPFSQGGDPPAADPPPISHSLLEADTPGGRQPP